MSHSEAWMSQLLTQLQAQLRPLAFEDLPKVHEVEIRVYNDPWSLQLLEESLKAPLTFTLGIFQGDLPLAYSIYQLIYSEGHLLNIAVHPEFQRQGLGSYLLHEVFLRAKRQGVLSLFLEVRPSNEGARKLYEKKGFKELMIREHYYSNGEAAVVMVKELL